MRPLAIQSIAMLLLAAGAASAEPRDDVLRIAPADAAVVIVVQNARTHIHNLTESPFFQWLPSSGIGKKLLDSPELKQLRDSGRTVFSELGASPTVLLEDVFGDAVAFAFTPAPPDKPGTERAVLIVRPRKLEVLQHLIDRINELQKRSGEVIEVARKEYSEAPYYERQKPAGASDFYCFRGETFVFSGTEAEIKAVIDRDKLAARGKSPELLTRMTNLGVADAAGVLLINPRAFDVEVKAKATAAKPDEKRFLTRFAEAWTALEGAAVYLELDKDLEIGVSVRFQNEKLPVELRPWLTGRRVAAGGSLLPERILFGFSGQTRATELIDLIASMAPLEPGKPDFKKWIEDTLGPIVGRDKLPLVLDALGPNWAVWAEPPAKEDVLPVFVAAVELHAEAENRGMTEKAVLEAVEYGFKTARYAYNKTHPNNDQIVVKEVKDPRTGTIVTTLVNDKGFPQGFRPSFAVVQGYLVIAGSPDAIRGFTLPARDKTPITDTSRVATFSATRTRAYLLAHGPHLAKSLSGLGVGAEKTLAEQFANLASVLELIDSADVILHRNDHGFKLAVHVTFAKPLK